MAKNKGPVTGDVTMEPTGVDLDAVLPVAAPTVKKFRVHLAAHTHVEFNGVEIEADNPEEAKDKFCEMNGIGGSTCPWTITEVLDGN